MEGLRSGINALRRKNALNGIRVWVSANANPKASTTVMIVDGVLLSPAVPGRLRGALHAAVLQSLVALGSFHQMSVLMWEDFDI